MGIILATSDNAETTAISHGIASISHLIQDLSCIHIYSDSFNAMKMVLDASLHSAQSHSLRTLDIIWPWLDDFPDSKVMFHYVLEVVSFLEHDLIHLRTCSTHVESDKDPPRSLAFAKSSLTLWEITFFTLFLRLVAHCSPLI